MKLRVSPRRGYGLPDGQGGDVNGEKTGGFLGGRPGTQGDRTTKRRAAARKPPLDLDRKSVRMLGLCRYPLQQAGTLTLVWVCACLG